MSIKYTAKAPAKINLALDVIAKRTDGYHDVVMIMQSVSLCDLITLKPISEDIIIISSNSGLIPKGKDNIVYKTAEIIKKKYNVSDGAKIQIEKNIPVAAGLGGGSTDAAAAIRLLNKAWHLRMSVDEMLAIAKEVGADVSFCIEGGTALAEGLGEKLKPLKPMPSVFVLLAKPEGDISTKSIYNSFDNIKIDAKPDIKAMVEMLDDGNIEGVANNLCNVLESVTMEVCPKIGILKEKLLENGALGSVMSGSGPTVFGIFNDEYKAYNAYDKIKEYADEVFLAKSMNPGWVE